MDGGVVCREDLQTGCRELPVRRVEMNRRNPSLFDAQRLDLAAGELELTVEALPRLREAG